MFPTLCVLILTLYYSLFLATVSTVAKPENKHTTLRRFLHGLLREWEADLNARHEARRKAAAIIIKLFELSFITDTVVSYNIVWCVCIYICILWPAVAGGPSTSL